MLEAYLSLKKKIRNILVQRCSSRLDIQTLTSSFSLWLLWHSSCKHICEFVVLTPSLGKVADSSNSYVPHLVWRRQNEEWRRHAVIERRRVEPERACQPPFQPAAYRLHRQWTNLLFGESAKYVVLEAASSSKKPREVSCNKTGLSEKTEKCRES